MLQCPRLKARSIHRPTHQSRSHPLEEIPVGGGDTEEERGRDRNDRDKRRRQEVWQEALRPVSRRRALTTTVDGSLNLRLEPALWGTILTALPSGSIATVIAGPVDGEGIAWYQVVTPEGVEGWCDGSFLATP